MDKHKHVRFYEADYGPQIIQHNGQNPHNRIKKATIMSVEYHLQKLNLFHESHPRNRAVNVSARHLSHGLVVMLVRIEGKTKRAISHIMPHYLAALPCLNKLSLLNYVEMHSYHVSFYLFNALCTVHIGIIRESVEFN